MIAALVLGGLLAALLVYASTKPARLHVQRSATITASRETVFALVDDLRQWPAWSHQDKADPSMARTYGAPSRGKGATSEWKSKGRGGEGRMQIVESVAPSRVVIKVDFARPFKASNTNEFTLDAAGEATKVTWAWDGTNVYTLKVMSVFVGMDKMMGKHFEKGLANLKALAERPLR
jgi:uncharacterized protein YndB with AHSA1/START domain